MDYKKFAKKYLVEVGAFDKDSNYGGMIGSAVWKLVETFSDEGHSGMSAFITSETFHDLNQAYSSEGKYKEKRSKIWDEYWKSPEGLKLQADVGTPNIMNKPPLL